MQKEKEQLMVAKDDYDIIMHYLRNGRSLFSREEGKNLEAELKKAALMEETLLPDDVVRLNSIVIIQDERGKTMDLMIVIPDKADMKCRRISVMSPIGTALLGFRKGSKVSWQVPAGKKIFSILEVHNSFAQP